ncbi:MAG: hypothetical protein JWN48_6055, partial [Myxococcaceae bacterium]|nr:hypothetical protein [Myxococcaceae bacterium]
EQTKASATDSLLNVSLTALHHLADMEQDTGLRPHWHHGL